MPLLVGTRLGPYEILGVIGAGGMGEVYKARDARLDRLVAVKVLSANLSSSPDARQRFERESRTISQLSHPHVCALYDVGEVPSHGSGAETIQFLVMELLEGETLATRLIAGPLPLEQTVRFGADIADALDKAHRLGIVHRDLKPANVMVTKSGVKLLDFGLAKAIGPLFPASMSDVETAASPPQLTMEGTIAGTLHYMAPEQLEGKPADGRSDLFALGAVLYEMATGKKAFAARSSAALASAILHEEPPPMVSGNAALPVAFDRITRTCLAKAPDDRWQSAHDVRLQLRAMLDKEETSGSIPATVVARRRSWVRVLPWAVAAVAIVAVAVLASLRPPRETVADAAVRLSLAPPPGGAFFESAENSGLSVSPDGSQIAFSARDASGVFRVWLRPLGALDASMLTATDGAQSMFWAPDGRSLAFFTGSKLRRVDLPGGTPVSICDVREGIGFAGTWGADGQILFASIEGEAIYRVAANGGEPAVALKPDPARDEVRLNWPLFLPDGRRFVYLQRRRDGSGHLMLADAQKAAREVMPVQSSVTYVEPGYLVFAREGALVGQRFDLSSGAVIGAPFSIADAVSYFLSTTRAQFATSLNGALVYQSHEEEDRLAWFDRSGRDVGTIGERGRYKNLRLSPDGRLLAFDRLRAGAYDVWDTDLERSAEKRLTFGVSSEGTGPWALPDGRSLFFNADQGAPPKIFRKNLTTGSEDLVLPASGTFQYPEDVSPDGKTLLYTERSAGGDHIWMLALDGSRPPAAAFTTSFEEESVRFSRDGHYFSFASNPSGRWEIYVSPFPPTGEKVSVSTAGGFGARWSRNGRELLYLSTDRRTIMSVLIQTSPSLRVGTPVPLFALDAARPWQEFDVSADGRFLAVVPERRANQQPLTVVLHWPAEIRH